MPYTLSRFALTDMIRCGAALREIGIGARSMQEVSERTVRHLFDSLQDDDGNPACALVRFYKTHPVGELPEHLAAYAQAASDGPLEAETPCLTLMATAGIEQGWNDVASSVSHQAIPIRSRSAMERMPMVYQLVVQLGLDQDALFVTSPELMTDLDQRSYNVFFVPEAKGSSHIPAQEEFVDRHGIASTLGFGGMLPNGHMFAAILFTTVPIDRAIADLFRAIALNIKVALLPYIGNQIFDPRPPLGARKERAH